MSLKPNRKLTDAGNPAKPAGEAGADMLRYMNEEHSDLTLWALDLFDYNKDDRILDIGCGGGATLRYLAERIEGGHFTGVDYSDVSVALSEETNAKHIAGGRMEIVSGSVSDLPFEDNTFNKAITVESFYFWPTPIESLKEVHRVLADNGVFLLVSEIYERPDLTQHSRDNIKRYNMNVPGIEEFKKLFHDAGFRKTEIHTKDGEYWIAVMGYK
ncbi:MAG: class I SAM-dependent methyltransferase [Lachnospiraceae bacterium]|nr:class I SAM-dependent methyltransferase [Lachnospiraceae bacterium]